MTTSDQNPRLTFSNVLRTISTYVRRIPPIYPLFFAIFITLGLISNSYQSANGILNFLRRVSPFAILAIGEVMVLASGGFDLSIGSIVTFVVLGSSLLLSNDPNKAASSIVIMLGLGIVIGSINGFIVSFLKVPSFITTLGMMLLVHGAVLYWIGGAPQGYLTDNWRFFGRNYIENVPLIGKFPVALIVLLVVAAFSSYALHFSNFGKQVFAIGDNVNAAKLSGAKVKIIRMLTFVFSSTLAVIAGILIGGAGGVNTNTGDGIEMQTIAACVLGGATLMGGKGSIPNVMFGAFTMEAIFNLLNLLGLPKPYRDVVQGIIIIIAVAYVALKNRKRR